MTGLKSVPFDSVSIVRICADDCAASAPSPHASLGERAKKNPGARLQPDTRISGKSTTYNEWNTRHPWRPTSLQHVAAAMAAQGTRPAQRAMRFRNASCAGRRRSALRRIQRHPQERACLLRDPDWTRPRGRSRPAGRCSLLGAIELAPPITGAQPPLRPEEAVCAVSGGMTKRPSDCIGRAHLIQAWCNAQYGYVAFLCTNKKPRGSPAASNKAKRRFVRTDRTLFEISIFPPYCGAISPPPVFSRQASHRPEA